jgi:hypothetical protein
MVKREVLTSLIDSKKSAILKVLLHSPESMYLKEISEKSQVSLASTFRILQELVSLELLERKEWKNSKVYSCVENEKVAFLQDVFKQEIDPLQVFVESVKEFQGINEVVLHKKKGKDINMILIGEYINSNRVQEVCDDINKQGFNVSFVQFTKQQFDQMSKMGLHQGENKILYKN